MNSEACIVSLQVKVTYFTLCPWMPNKAFFARHSFLKVHKVIGDRPLVA